MANVDWIQIKNEYINTEISQRKLAEKYGISFPTLRDRAKREEWKISRGEQRDKIMTVTLKKTADKIVKSEVDRLTNILNLTDKLTPKIEKAIEQLETMIVNGESIDTGVVDTYRMRQIVQSLKDLKDITQEGRDEYIEDMGDVEKEVFGE